MKAPLVTALCLAAVSPDASCADEHSKRWSGQIAAASQYVSRGFQQSWGQSAIHAGVQFDLGHGFAAGAWGSTVSPYFVEGGHVERDLYLAYALTHQEVTYHGALYDYHYPGARIRSSNTSYDYQELVLGADWRTWSLSYAMTVSRNYFGFDSATIGIGRNQHSYGSGYLDISRRFALGRAYNLSVHVGWQRVNHFADYGWQDLAVTLSHPWGSVDLSVSYARGWNHAGVYRHYTTGVIDDRGRSRYSNPIAGTAFLSASYAF